MKLGSFRPSAIDNQSKNIMPRANPLTRAGLRTAQKAMLWGRQNLSTN